MNSPLGKVFNECFIPDGVSDAEYNQKFHNSIDLSMIKANVQKNKYKSITHWKNDMIECFKQFDKLGKFSDNYIISSLANHALNKFHKLCRKYLPMSYSQWFSYASILDDRLNQLINSHPELSKNIDKDSIITVPTKKEMKDLGKEIKLLLDQSKINDFYSLVQMFNIYPSELGQLTVNTNEMTPNQARTIINFIKQSVPVTK